MKKSGKIALGLITSFVLLGAVIGSVFVIKEFTREDNITKDEKALVIGVQKLQDNLPVALTFRLVDGDRVFIDKTFISNDGFMQPVDGQNQDLVFYDFTDDIAPYIGDSLFYWINAADGWENHKITVSTTCLNGAIKSSDFYITDSGIYFIGVAEINGFEPTYTSYAVIYREKVFGE